VAPRGLPTLHSIRKVIQDWAAYYGVDPDFLLCIAGRESGLSRTALGKNGEVGLFQFMDVSWVLVRKAMGLLTWTWLRLDVGESARTAAYAIGVLDLARWWSTRGECE